MRCRCSSCACVGRQANTVGSIKFHSFGICRIKMFMVKCFWSFCPFPRSEEEEAEDGNVQPGP